MATGDCDYLKNMTSDITQMVVVLSNWGADSLNWLEHGACTGSCSRSETFQSFSNLSFLSASAMPKPPTPTPEPEPPTPEPVDENVIYRYGNECT